MAKSKYYMTIRCKTKEDFDAHFNSIYLPAKEQGFKEGLEVGLSHLFDLMTELTNIFGPETMRNAEHISEKRLREIAKHRLKERSTKTE